MSGTYSGSYMGFPAPEDLDPCDVTGFHRKRAAILRAAGIPGVWRRLSLLGLWCVAEQGGNVRRRYGHFYTCAAAQDRHEAGRPA